MTVQRDPETIQRLADAFDKAQRFGGGERPIDVATSIAGASDPVWEAAMHWLEHGEMPEEPAIRGYNPRMLTRVKGLVPSAALTALMALKEDASAALLALSQMEDRGPDAGKAPGWNPADARPRDARPISTLFRPRPEK